MPQVVDDGTNGYLHDVTGNSVAIGDTTDDATYPLADALGSTRLTLDDTGTPLGTTDWDAWGNERTSTGAGFEFGYTGQQYDGSSDLYFNRARYYSPGTAQFLSRDTIQPSSGGATGYNPYQYANSNPTTLTDPSGHLASIGDFGGGIAGAFLYLAYIFECFLSGNCRYQGAHGGSGFELGHAKTLGCSVRRLTARATVGPGLDRQAMRFGTPRIGQNALACGQAPVQGKYPVPPPLLGCVLTEMAGTVPIDQSGIYAYGCGGGQSGGSSFGGGGSNVTSFSEDELARMRYMMHTMFDITLSEFDHQRALQPPGFDWGYNGCSIPTDGLTGFLVDFARWVRIEDLKYVDTSHTYACARHDFGYRNLSPSEYDLEAAFPGPGTANLKHRTDLRLRDDIKEACTWLPPADLESCQEEAGVIYLAVDKFGGNAWRDAK